MSLKQIRECSLQLLTETDLCTWLQLFSIITWNKIEFATRTDEIKLYENTITQDLVFNFSMLAGSAEFPIKLYLAKNEKCDGNDLEIFVETDFGYVFLATQAKIMKRNFYPGVKHMVGDRNQIDLLINYAAEKSGIPVYLLYNFCDDLETNEKIEEITGLSIENYGCTLANAKYIKKHHYNTLPKVEGLRWKIPSFGDLHPEFAVPLQRIICNPITELIPGFAQKIQIGEIKLYERDELFNDNNWRDMTPKGRIGFVPSLDKQARPTHLETNLNIGFSPKYRIVISKQIEQSGLYRYS